jgi:hypothetical protein
MDNLEIWNNLSRPPKEFLKPINGGRLRGMTDVNPQWRLKAMTLQFGLIGVGWKYQTVERWKEECDGQVACFVRIELFILDYPGHWSEPIEGIGGSMLLAKEKNGLYFSDEAYKMALTDALSVAMKQLGVAADIYAGLWDGSKYRDTVDNDNREQKQSTPPPQNEAKQEAQQAQKELGDKFDQSAAAGQPAKRPAPSAAERNILNVLREYWITKITSPSMKVDNEKVLDVTFSLLGRYPTLDDCLKIKDETSPFFIPLEKITKVVA